MIWDCFIFDTELDVLELRLTELDLVVDRFVLCEGTRTFQGEMKRLWFDENQDRFARWLPKIKYIVCDLPAGELGKWDREKTQRNALRTGLIDCSPDDLILLSDVDEIPHPLDLAVAEPPCTFSGPMCYYFLNCRATNYTWHGPRLYRFDGLRRKMSRARFGRNPFGGRAWHFSHLGGVEVIQQKLRAGSHTEYAGPEWRDESRIRDAIARRIDLYGRRFRYHIVPIDETFPKCVQRDPDKWRKHIAPW